MLKCKKYFWIFIFLNKKLNGKSFFLLYNIQFFFKKKTWAVNKLTSGQCVYID
jgi:hypothetical protein